MENIHDNDDPLLEAARLGLDVEQFTNMPGGLALVELAMGDLNRAMLTLIEESDLQSPAARQAHSDARAAYGVMKYIKHCTTTGKLAVAQIQEEEEHGQED